MLQLILGSAASGKTTEIFSRIQNDVANNREVLLIVPEQFTFETERAVLRLLNDRDAARVTVFSFSRLCEAVEFEVGGISGHNLSDSDKLILLNRAMISAADELKLWNRYVGSQGFLSSLLQSIEEMKQAAISAEDLFARVEEVDSPILSAKMHDIATVYSHYTALMGERFIDPSDRMDRLYHHLEHSDFFGGKQVYLDSFKGFTGQQFRVLDRIFSQAENITISMPVKEGKAAGWDVFTNVRVGVERIRRMAKDHGISIEKDIYLNHFSGVSPSLRAVEDLLSGHTVGKIEADGCLTLCQAESPYDEAQFVARTIRRLVREDRSLRYRDFVIIARDTAPYEQAVMSACEQNSVAVFLDKRQSLDTLPTSIAAQTAVSFAENPSVDLLMRFYKIGLGDFSQEELFLLENYSFLWNLKIKDWFREWDMDPEGFRSSEEKTIDQKQLADLNELRLRAITPLQEFRNNYKGSAKDRVKALMQLFEACNARSCFMTLCNTYADSGLQERADLLKQSWDALMNIFNSLVYCCAETSLTHKEFRKMLSNATALTTVGVAPQTLDEVTFGAADRIRPQRPKVAFVLGANQGVFPKSIVGGGLFVQHERAKLIELGLEIADHSIRDTIDEDFLVYSNLCCASEQLYLCCSKQSADKNALEPSLFYSRIAERIPHRSVVEPDELSTDNLPETAERLLSEACLRHSFDVNGSATLNAALEDMGSNEYTRRMQSLKTQVSAENMEIQPKTAEKLYGKKIYLSASKLDVFHRCAFQYFCRHGLRAKRLQPAVFDVLQRGTLVHYCLERFIETQKGNFENLSDDEIPTLVRTFTEEYLDSVQGYRSIETDRTRYLVDNIVRSTAEVATQIAHEFAQSQFNPHSCELKFGSYGTLPPLSVDFENGSVEVTGSIDRVDTWNGYVRIVDYKTGKKEFKLPDILLGQNLQMLLYLYALSKNEGFKELKPAGIFYMPALRDRKEEGLAMKGLMPDDEDLVYAMERENEGKYIPKYRLTKKGTLDSRAASSFIGEQDFNTIFSYIDRLLSRTGQTLLSGEIAARPRNGRKSTACQYCDFAAICAIRQDDTPDVPSMKNAEVLREIEKEVENIGD